MAQTRVVQLRKSETIAICSYCGRNLTADQLIIRGADDLQGMAFCCELHEELASRENAAVVAAGDLITERLYGQ